MPRRRAPPARDTFILDRPGLARLMSLPPGEDTFSSPYLRSYRIRQGVLHNPRQRPPHHAGSLSHRRRRLADSRGQAGRARADIRRACSPPRFSLPRRCWPSPSRPARRSRLGCSSPCYCVPWFVRPPEPIRKRPWRFASSLPEVWSAISISWNRSSAAQAIRIFPKMTPRSTPRIGPAIPAASSSRPTLSGMSKAALGLPREADATPTTKARRHVLARPRMNPTTAGTRSRFVAATGAASWSRSSPTIITAIARKKSKPRSAFRPICTACAKKSTPAARWPRRPTCWDKTSMRIKPSV